MIWNLWDRNLDPQTCLNFKNRKKVEKGYSSHTFVSINVIFVQYRDELIYKVLSSSKMRLGRSAECRKNKGFFLSFVDGGFHITIWVVPFRSSRSRSNTSLGGSVPSTSCSGPPCRISVVGSSASSAPQTFVVVTLASRHTWDLGWYCCHSRTTISLHVSSRGLGFGVHVRLPWG